MSEYYKKSNLRCGWEKVGHTQYKIIWNYDIPNTVRNNPILISQWLNTDKIKEKISSNHSLEKALRDSRDLFNPSSYYAGKEYYCNFFGNPAITGIGFIDAFDKKTKNEESKMFIKEKIGELEEQELHLKSSIEDHETELKAWEESIEENEEEIEEAKEKIRDVKETLAHQNHRLKLLSEKINYLREQQPQIYRIKPLRCGKLYVELQRCYEGKKEGIIHFVSPPFCNRVMGFEESLFQEAYICPCRTKLGWTLDKNTKIKINIKEFIPFFE